MHIDLQHFTPLSALFGGLLIGGAAALLVLKEKRILGASGLLAGLLPPRAGDIGWRIALLSGLVAAPLIAKLVIEVPTPRIEATWPVVILGGLLVGFGTRLGGGCTSGHGVCGLSRLSLRSLVATLVFMTGGFATVFVLRHILA